MKQDVIDRLLVVKGNRGQLFGDGEDHVEVLDGQQFGGAIMNPVWSRNPLQRCRLIWTLGMKDNKWLRLLTYVTGLVNQELLLQNEYLAAENGFCGRTCRRDY